MMRSGCVLGRGQTDVGNGPDDEADHDENGDRPVGTVIALPIMRLSPKLPGKAYDLADRLPRLADGGEPVRLRLRQQEQILPPAVALGRINGRARGERALDGAVGARTDGDVDHPSLAQRGPRGA
jgi:hypothetical protein